MRLKLISGIFISLFAVILMSHNVGALSSNSFIPGTAIGPFKTSFSSSLSDDSTCSTLDPDYKHWIYTNWNIGDFGNGKTYLVAFTFFNSVNSNSFDGKIPIQWHAEYENWVIIKETELVNVSPSQFTLYMIIEKKDGATTGAGYNFNIYSNDWIILYNHECVSNYGYVTQIYWSGLENYTQQLNNITSQIQSIGSSVPSQTQINNLNNSVNELNTSVENRNRAEFDAVDNINDQTPSDIGNTDSPQTTSLLNTIGNFIGALGNLSATNCIVDLNFPSFAGGTQRVNVCQNKQYTGNIVQVAGSIFLVVFYIPIAFMLLSKIYNEIKSFTNG